MADPKAPRSGPPGLLSRDSSDGGVSGIEIAAGFFGAIWLAVSGWYFLTGGGTEAASMRFILILMVVFLPVMLIWVAAMAARQARVLREESARLQAAIDAIRQAYVAQAQQGRSDMPHPALLKRLDEIAAYQKTIDGALTGLAAGPAPETAPKPQTASGGDDQPTLSLGTPAEALAPPLSTSDFIRALHFPETAEDAEGFNALRRALKDREVGQLVQAAQDVLTLLSQDGIYMDDLRPDMARPEIWRAFAKGERGRAVAALGGVRDRTSLALAAGRMKQDPIFRDAAHHFLRRFDKSFATFEARASDPEISDFGLTRTARAFMLLGRVAGTFD